MKVAVVSDVHGNLTALEAVVRDIQAVGADVVINGGDLVGSGARPAEVIDLVSALRWPGVVGNTDQVLWDPEPLRDLAQQLPALRTTWDIVFEDVERTRNAIGAGRIQWLRKLPDHWSGSGVAVVHASPGDTWKAPSPSAPDAELAATYAALQSRLVVYGHVHVPFIRPIADLVVANAGSVGMPYDGDPRASYLILDGARPTIRRVAYDIDAEVRALEDAGHPQREWVAAMLRAGKYLAPPGPRSSP